MMVKFDLPEEDEGSVREFMVDRDFDDIVEKLKDSAIWGMRIDFDNIRHVAVAAFYLGKGEIIERVLKE